MPPEIIPLIEKHLPLTIGLAAGMFFGLSFEGLGAGLRRQRWQKRNGGRWTRKGRADSIANGPWRKEPDPATSSRARDAADQLRIVMRADFSVQPLLNRSEARLFRELDRTVIGCNPGWQVMAQVSLGEVLRSTDAEAYGCINSKRVDLLLMDEHCRPRHAIEYQGSAHHLGTAAARDAVKKEALRRAGIGYHEVVAGQITPSDLRRLVERLVDRPNAA